MDDGNDHGTAKRILILGGTGEARTLATALVAHGHAVTSSLAGRTATPLLPPGEVRIGGFGGVSGLADYLVAARTDLVIDATHPFAARISANAVAACAQTQTPLIRLERPAWQKPVGAEWIEVPDMAAAAGALPAGAKVLLTIGRQDLAAFHSRSDCQFIARMIEVPENLPADWASITAQGPFTHDEETALLRRHAVTHLVSKNSGGGQTAAKLTAASALGIPVVMIARPHPPDAKIVDSVTACLRLIRN